MPETLYSTIDTFLLDAQTRGLRPFSLDTYRRALGYFARFATNAGATTIDQVTPALLRVYVVDMQSRGLSPASIRSNGRVLRAWLNFCKAEGLLEDADPMRRVRMPKATKPNPSIFTVDDVRKLLAIADVRDAAVVLFLLDTGCRVGEFAQLRHGDIDMATGAVTLRGETTKTHRTRTVYLGRQARAALAAYFASLPPASMAADAPVWYGRWGALTRDGVRKLVQRLGKNAGVNPCGPHRFRRTAATWMLRDGASVKDAAGLLGHSVDELLRSYIRADDESLRAAHAQHGPVDRMLKK